MSKKLLSILALMLSVMLLAAACGPDEADDVADPADTTDPAADPTTPEADPTTPAETPADTGTGTEPTGDGADVSIAYQGPLTGDNAALGINMLRGMEIAVAELSEQGINITIEQLDSQGDPAQAPALSQGACADEAIVAVVGPSFSGETAASGPIYDGCGLPFISPSATAPDLSANGWTHFFRTVGTDADQGPVAATFIAETLGVTAASVVDDASEYGLGLADIVATELEAAGVEIVAREGIEAGGSDFSTVVGNVVQSGAEAIFFGGYFSDAGLLRSQLTDQGGGEIVFVSADGSFDGGFMEIAGDSANGSFITFPGADPAEADQAFLDAFDEGYGEPPGAFSVEAYQNVLLIGEALAAGNTDRESIREFVAGFSGEIFGSQIEFSDVGDITIPGISVYEVVDGAFVFSERFEL